MAFTDKTITCAECSDSFVFTAGEQQFFHDKNFTNHPKRCKRCRTRRTADASSNGKGRTHTHNSNADTAIICSACGVESTVPFVPKNNRTVLCRACFKGQQAQQQAQYA